MTENNVFTPFEEVMIEFAEAWNKRTPESELLRAVNGQPSTQEVYKSKLLELAKYEPIFETTEEDIDEFVAEFEKRENATPGDYAWIDDFLKEQDERRNIKKGRINRMSNK